MPALAGSATISFLTLTMTQCFGVAARSASLGWVAPAFVSFIQVDLATLHRRAINLALKAS
jgi:hypothetical protein